MSRARVTLPLLLALTALAAVLAGCTYVKPPVLSIAKDGKEQPFFTLTQDDLQSKLDAASSSTTTSAKAYVDAGTVAQTLTQLVQQEILKQIVTERNLQPNEQDVQRAQAQSQSQSTPDDNQAKLMALDRVLAEEAFAKGVLNKDEQARQTFEANKANYATPEQLCLHVIVIQAGSGQAAATPAELADAKAKADAARARLNGEPFETVADATSASASRFPGGQLGCASESDLQLPAATWTQLQNTAVGGITDPIDLQDQVFLIFRVDEKKPATQPTFDQVKDKVVLDLTYAVGQQLRSRELQRIGDTFVVTVDPKYGTWDPQTLSVVAPAGAATPTTATTTTTTSPLVGAGPTAGSTPGSTPGSTGSTPGSAPNP